MSESTVDITSAIANAVKVPARDVRVGDYVFSTFGEPDRVIKVSDPRNKRRTTITPENLWPLVVAPDDQVTILQSRECVGCFARVAPGVPGGHSPGCPTGQNGTPYYE